MVDVVDGGKCIYIYILNDHEVFLESWIFVPIVGSNCTNRFSQIE